MSPPDQEQLELEHICLEIRSGRGHHFRHFVDSYFCYKHGYVNRSGKANSELIRGSEYVSPAAALLADKTAVVKEHVVPLREITARLMKIEEPTPDKVRSILDDIVVFATITKEEDGRVSSLGLKSKMPEEYYDPQHCWFNDPFARYHKADVIVTRVDRL